MPFKRVGPAPERSWYYAARRAADLPWTTYARARCWNDNQGFTSGRCRAASLSLRTVEYRSRIATKMGTTPSSDSVSSEVVETWLLRSFTDNWKRAGLAAGCR